MKAWAIITTLLYILIIGILALPYLQEYYRVRIFSNNEYVLITLVVLLVTQMTLLIIPVRQGLKRFLPKRSIKLFIFYSGFFVILMVLATIVNLLLIFDEEYGLGFLIAVPIALVSVWIIWGIIMFRYYKVHDQDHAFRHTMDALLKTSIAEVLVAIPTHIITRQRDDCCAPPISMIGIITGVVILFFAFGPAALFLYRIRFKKKRRR